MVTTIQPKHLKRDLDILRDNAVYLIDIGIYVGTSNRRMEWAHLGLNHETIVALKAANSAPPSLKVFESLSSKANKLKSMRDRIQRRFLVYCSPFWFVKESDVEEMYSEIELLVSECAKLRNDALLEYLSERDRYETTIRQILTTTQLSQEKIEEIVNSYLAYFPSREKVAHEFRVEIQGFMRVPSVREQSMSDAELAMSEARLREAKALEKLQQDFSAQIQQKFTQAVEYAKDEFYGILAAQLEKLEKVAENDGMNNRQQRALFASLERLERLVSFDENLTSLSELSGKFADIASLAYGDNFAAMNDKIQELRKSLQSEVEVIASTGSSGHRALAAWVL